MSGQLSSIPTSLPPELYDQAGSGGIMSRETEGGVAVKPESFTPIQTAKQSSAPDTLHTRTVGPKRPEKSANIGNVQNQTKRSLDAAKGRGREKGEQTVGKQAAQQAPSLSTNVTSRNMTVLSSSFVDSDTVKSDSFTTIQTARQSPAPDTLHARTVGPKRPEKSVNIGNVQNQTKLSLDTAKGRDHNKGEQAVGKQAAQQAPSLSTNVTSRNVTVLSSSFVDSDSVKPESFTRIQTARQYPAPDTLQTRTVGPKRPEKSANIGNVQNRTKLSLDTAKGHNRNKGEQTVGKQAAQQTSTTETSCNVTVLSSSFVDRKGGQKAEIQKAGKNAKPAVKGKSHSVGGTTTLPLQKGAPTGVKSQTNKLQSATRMNSDSSPGRATASSSQKGTIPRAMSQTNKLQPTVKVDVHSSQVGASASSQQRTAPGIMPQMSSSAMGNPHVSQKTIPISHQQGTITTNIKPQINRLHPTVMSALHHSQKVITGVKHPMNKSHSTVGASPRPSQWTTSGSYHQSAEMATEDQSHWDVDKMEINQYCYEDGPKDEYGLNEGERLYCDMIADEDGDKIYDGEDNQELEYDGYDGEDKQELNDEDVEENEEGLYSGEEDEEDDQELELEDNGDEDEDDNLELEDDRDEDQDELALQYGGYGENDEEDNQESEEDDQSEPVSDEDEDDSQESEDDREEGQYEPALQYGRYGENDEEDSQESEDDDQSEPVSDEDDQDDDQELDEDAREYEPELEGDDYASDDEGGPTVDEYEDGDDDEQGLYEDCGEYEPGFDGDDYDDDNSDDNGDGW